MPESKRLLMGRIGAAHGIKGEVRIQSFAEEPLALVGYKTFSTNRPGLTITVQSARATTNVLVARLAGVNDRNAAEKLNGVELYIERDRLPAIEDDDDFYIADLIGLEARGEDGGVLGKVVAVPNYGADDILEIGGPGGETRLVPFTRAAVPEIHIAEGYLVVIPPVEIEGEDVDKGEDEDAGRRQDDSRKQSDGDAA
ncbi:MAG TPA: ribosome maturation factor RimM [Devosia sp.]|nr:ribosome maturation factor RimM [Devosia sp.]